MATDLRHRLTRMRLIRMIYPLAIAVALVGCRAESTNTEPVAAPLRPVKTIEANANGAAAQRIVASTVISADSQDLSFRIGGAITELPVTVGQRLKAGELIAALDHQPLKLGEKEARAQLAQAEATYRNAASQYRRTRELYSTEASSLSDLESAKANAASARANRALAREGLNSAQLNLGYGRLLSPTENCQVVSVPVAVNQNISAGQTIVTTACGDQLRLRTVIPESLINRIQLGMPVSAQLQSGNIELAGKVVEIGVSSSESSGYAVEVEIDNPPPAVRVGMAAEITLNLTSDRKRLLIPLIAVLSDSSGKYVFIAEPDGDNYRIVRRAVKTGELGNDGIEILQGVQSGQRVVVAGMSRISEGMKVTLYTGADQ